MGIQKLLLNSINIGDEVLVPPLAHSHFLIPSSFYIVTLIFFLFRVLRQFRICWKRTNQYEFYSSATIPLNTAYVQASTKCALGYEREKNYHMLKSLKGYDTFFFCFSLKQGFASIAEALLENNSIRSLYLKLVTTDNPMVSHMIHSKCAYDVVSTVYD